MAHGNDQKRWQKLLELLDEKLQLGLLDQLRRVHCYYFEQDTLYLEPSDTTNAESLTREPLLQQLQLFARATMGVKDVVVKAPK